MRDHTGKRRIDAAREYGYKDGSAVTHILKKLESQRESNPAIAARICSVEREIQNGISCFQALTPYAIQSKSDVFAVSSPSGTVSAILTARCGSRILILCYERSLLTLALFRPLKPAPSVEAFSSGFLAALGRSVLRSRQPRWSMMPRTSRRITASATRFAGSTPHGESVGDL